MTAGCRKLAAVSFTAKGCRLNALLCQALSREGYDVEAWGKEPYAGEQGLTPLTEPLKAWTGRDVSGKRRHFVYWRFRHCCAKHCPFCPEQGQRSGHCGHG